MKALACVSAAVGVALSLATAAKDDPWLGYGPSPNLPAPDESLIPTVDIAPAKGWPQGATPTAASGLEVTAFATQLEHPRWLYVLPNGDVLVAETNAPAKPDDAKGVKGFVMEQVMKKAGSTTPTAN